MNTHWKGFGAGKSSDRRGLFVPILMEGGLLLLACVFAQTASASRSGLNNVPNADTSVPGAGVLQLYSAFGEERDTSALAGVRYDFSMADQMFEAGVDGRWQAGDAVAFLNARWALPRRAGIPSFALGIANMFHPFQAHRLGRRCDPDPESRPMAGQRWLDLSPLQSDQPRTMAEHSDRAWQHVYDRETGIVFLDQMAGGPGPGIR